MTSQPPTEPLQLSHVFGSTRRKGHWVVPEQITLRQRMGSTDLDLTEADFSGPVTTLDVDMIGGSVELRIPADVVVDASLRTVLASLEDHRDDAPARGARTLRLRGRAVWGSIEIRGPRANRGLKGR